MENCNIIIICGKEKGLEIGDRADIGKNCQKENEEFVKNVTSVRELLRQNKQKKLECLKKIANNAKNAIAYL